MADITSNEKTTPTHALDSPPSSHTTSGEEAGQITRPKAWMYKPLKIGPLRLPWYASPPTQLTMVAFVCFLCPGMFNAVGGLGGGGQVDATAANNGLVATYSTFSVVGFFAGSIANRLGIKLTLSLGGLGYSVYIASLLSYNHTQNAGFIIFAGALLGVCAGLLWTAQGAIMMSYPHESSKGRYISWFWMIFNLGAVIGSLVRSHPSLTGPDTDFHRLGPPRSKFPLYCQCCQRRNLYCLFGPHHRRSMFGVDSR